jgi:hypothetical protein
VAKRDAGAAMPAKYFFVREESLHDAEALFISIGSTVFIKGNLLTA